MKLYFQSFINEVYRKKMIILHGLFGSSKNWFSIAKEFSRFFSVYALDLRNHGNSPHSEVHSLTAMIEDVYEFINDRDIDNTILLGHSMGGLVSMGFSLMYPEKITELIVVDIAPKIYDPHHQREFEVFKIDISHCKSREQIDELLSKVHPIKEIRNFLMMNLYNENQQYRWKINWKVLEKSDYLQDFSLFENKKLNKPVLFIRALDSFYIKDEDYKKIYEIFPAAIIKELKGNHWIHYSNQKDFINSIYEFLYIHK